MDRFGPRRSPIRAGSTALSASRRRFLVGITVTWLAATAALYASPPGSVPFGGAATTGPPRPDAPVAANTVVVTHWAAGHLMPDHLLPKFAREFNATGRRTASGERIEVRLAKLDSFEQVDKLELGLRLGKVAEPALGEPVLVTPVVDHWLAELNERVGRAVVDLDRTENLAIAWTGIATYREMAECLGWPQREVGYAEIMAVISNEHGWASCPTARAAWGQRPLMSYTDPSTSSTARSVLFGLYSVAAGKPAEQLTEADVSDPRVTEYVTRFQRGVDHYVPNTLVLLTKMTLGYSHLYWIAEDVLVQLKQGKAPIVAPPGTQIHPLAGQDMVFIHPKAGSIPHNNPAGVLQAPWVTAEQGEAANQWIAFLREPQQQEALMDEGFRPATDLPVRCPICGSFGLSPNPPATVLKPMKPAVAASIVQRWDLVKKPGVVTFVLDSSSSMAGAKLAQAKKGLVEALDGLSANTSVGFISFDAVVRARVPVTPVQAGRFQVAQEVQRTQASGGTALYTALAEAISMTDAAEGDVDAIRGVVVLTDGQSNAGLLNLDGIVTMSSRDEEPIAHFDGREGTKAGTVANSTKLIPKDQIQGLGLKLTTKHPIHVFFVGIGDADPEVGRILAEATNSAYQQTTEKSLAEVLAAFGKYF